MASLADMTVTLGLDDKDFVKGINNAENNVKKFGATSEKELSRTSELFGKLKTVLAGVAFGELITQSAQFGAEIVKTAQSLQTSTAAVYAWQSAFGAAGGDIDNARDALIDLTQKMSEAINNGGDVLTAFNRIGLSISKLKTLSNEDLMKAVVKGLANVKDGAERSRLALILMGEDAKNVDFTQVNSSMDGFLNRANKISPALEAARKSQQEFNNTYQKFQEQLVVAIPWESISAGLKSIGDNLEGIKSLIIIIAELGAAYLGITKILPIFAAGQAAVYTSIGTGITAFKTFGTVLASMVDMMAAQFAIFLGGMKNAGLVLFGFGNTAVGVFDSLKFAALGFFGALGRLAIIYTVADAVNSLVKSLTGLDILDKIGFSVNALSRDFTEFGDVLNYIGIAYLGMSGNLAEATNKYNIAMDHYTKGSEYTAESIKKIVDETENWYDEASKMQGPHEKTSQLLEQQKKDIASIYQQYRQQNDQALKKLGLDGELIGATEEQKRVQTELMNIENQRQGVIQGLKQKIAEATDPAVIKGYSDAIQQVNKDFDEQKGKVSGVISNNLKKEILDKASADITARQIDLTNSLADAENQRAAMFLPAIEQKYKDIEIAANKAYAAQIQAVADTNFGGDVNAKGMEEVKKRYAALREQTIAANKESAKSDYETNNAKKYTVQLEQLQYDQAKQLRDIQNEIAYQTMPAYQQIAAKINADTDQRINDTIRQIELERGQTMSISERAQWTETLRGNTDQLIKKQQESYIVSRQWNTGWTRAMNDYIENATNAAKVAENVFSKAMSGMEDMFVNFVKTGKFQWKDFVNTMLEELLRAQFQSVFAKIFGAATGNSQGASSGSLLGGLFSSFSGMFADGGTIGAGKWGVVGEAGPEIVQGPANITPMKNIGTSSNTYVSYNISAVDAMSFKQMIARDPSFIHAVAMQGAKAIPGRR